MPTRVGAYADVNPVTAVIIGSALGGEAPMAGVGRRALAVHCTGQPERNGAGICHEAIHEP